MIKATNGTDFDDKNFFLWQMFLNKLTTKIVPYINRKIIGDQGLIWYVFIIVKELAERSKLPRSEKCIVHDESSDLTSPRDIESSNTSAKAARIRNYKSVIDLANTVDEGVIPRGVMYRRKCRSLSSSYQLRTRTSM